MSEIASEGACALLHSLCHLGSHWWQREGRKGERAPPEKIEKERRS